MIPSTPFLCYITDESLPMVEIARQALEGGALMIQLRNKTASGEQLYRWAEEIQALCRLHQALFIVNDRVDIAIASGADGVHLGQQDLPAPAARKLLGPDKLLGVSVSSSDEAAAAERNGADYVGFGHIFPTGSKQKHTAPIGPEAIAAVRTATDLPVVAIGGITPQNAFLTLESGASGIAVIAAISRSGSPRKAARSLVDLLEHHH
ncbi:MAG: thiamine phosphate synthase [Chlorobi bacterium]|nr:thiamine phosphate synthase [Chlorobiota bacterium]